jgi:hypothetical protein
MSGSETQKEKLFYFLDAAEEVFGDLDDEGFLACMRDVVKGFNQMNRTHFTPGIIPEWIEWHNQGIEEETNGN